MDDKVADWRGAPITEGALVIYGSPVSRSITLVEGVVRGFTPSGRVWVEITRRSYGKYRRAEVVHVGADRLTVVLSLPPATVETAEEHHRRLDAERAERDRIAATHTITYGPESAPDWQRAPMCARCGTNGYPQLTRVECG